MILVSLGLFASSRVLAPERSGQLPGWDVILLNFLYLQDLTQCGSIVAVAWTLCIEIQFYVVFISLLCFCRSDHAAGLHACGRSVRRLSFVDPSAAVLSVWLAVGLGSLPFKDLINAPHRRDLALLGVLAWSPRRFGQCSVRYTPFSLVILVSISADTAWFLPYWYMFRNG